MWCCRKMEKIIWPDCVRNEVLHRVDEGRSILCTINKKENQGDWTYLSYELPLRTRYWKKYKRKDTEVPGRRGRRCKQPLDDFQLTWEYCKLKEEALDSTPWKTRLRRGYGAVARRTTEWMSVYGGGGFGLTERGDFPPTDECVEIRFPCRSPSCETEVFITAEKSQSGNALFMKC
jgi:hypothetical protein